MVAALSKKISTEENGLDLVDSMDLQFADLNNVSDSLFFLDL